MLLQAYPIGNTDTQDQEDEGLSAFATPEPVQTSTPTPTSTAEPVAREELTINILNGTGVAGEASLLQAELTDLGYDNIEASNAEDQDETRTTVTYGPSVGEDVKEEINDLLEEMYTDVRIVEDELDEFDIQILTGPRQASGSDPDESSSPSPDAEE